MDLVKFQASLDAHTAALNVHSAAIDKLIAHAGGTAPAGEAAPASRGRGRPTNAERAAAQSAQPVSSALASAANTAAVQPSAAVNQGTATPSTPVNGPLTHLALKDKFLAFGRSKGRDAVVALLKEFGATEFGKVKTEDLPLFQDRLDGKPQTPVAASDMDNLLGM